MFVGGRPKVCPECGAPLWSVFEDLEPISGLYIGEVNCLGCEGGWLYAKHSGQAPVDDEEE